MMVMGGRLFYVYGGNRVGYCDGVYGGNRVGFCDGRCGNRVGYCDGVYGE